MRILINNQSKESTYYDPRKAVKRNYYYDDDEEEQIQTPTPQPVPEQNPTPRGRPRTERDNRFYEKLQISDSDDEKTKRIKQKALKNLQRLPGRNLASTIVILISILVFAVGCSVLVRLNILTNLSIGLFAGAIFVMATVEILIFIFDFRLPSDLRRIPTKIIAMIGAVIGYSYFLMFLLIILKVLPPNALMVF